MLPAVASALAEALEEVRTRPPPLSAKFVDDGALEELDFAAVKGAPMTQLRAVAHTARTQRSAGRVWHFPGASRGRQVSAERASLRRVL